MPANCRVLALLAYGGSPMHCVQRFAHGAPTLLALSMLLVGCSGSTLTVARPCPTGQQLREDRYDATHIRSRGCISRDAQGAFSSSSPLEGRWEYFYPNGQKQAEGEYLHAKQSGEKGATGILRDGREGKWTLWHLNGRRSQEAVFRGGKLEGVVKQWYESGQQSVAETFRGDKLEGAAVAWHENGQKKEEGAFRDDQPDGVVTTYYESGQKKSEYTYREGKEEGLATKWYANGQKEAELTFASGTLVSVQKWDENGTPAR